MNKTIQFNSEFLSTVSKKKPSNGTRKKEKPVLTDKNNSKVLRQKLLERIKEYQNRTQTTNGQKPDPLTINSPSQQTDNTFTNSLEILKGLSSDIGHNKTVKHRPSDSDVSTEMPDCFKDDKVNYPATINQGSPENINGVAMKKVNEDEKNDHDTSINIYQPAYSCIKNGSRPTYKELASKSEIQKETDLPNSPDTSASSSDPSPSPSTSSPPINIKEHVSKKPQQSRKRMITKTYKYMLGKNGRNVSVLLKDMKTRKMVKKECSQLANTPIHDIKQYLRKKNLLKIGSNATDDVVAKIYEQAVLTGEVRNMSKDTLIHNFMKT